MVSIIFRTFAPRNLEGRANLYYTGTKFPTNISLESQHYFMPMIKGLGVRDVYEIVRIKTITARKAKQLDVNDPQGDDIRLSFVLRFSHRLYEEYRMLNEHKLSNNTFIDTTFDEIGDFLKKQTSFGMFDVVSN